MAAKRTARKRSRNRIAVANPIKISLINEFNKRKSHGSKKNQGKEETSKKKSRGNGRVNDISNTITRNSFYSRDVNVDDIIVYEILSRLPVKSLMRFKCVSKHWYSVIRKDQHFIDLHLSRSKARQRLLISVPYIDHIRSPNARAVSRSSELYLVTGDLLFEGGEVSPTVDSTRVMSTNWFRISKPLNGLICLYTPTKSHGIQVCNINTREITSWIESSSLDGEGFVGNPKCDLGFDPVTKEHKVICMWNIKFDHQVCEVLTVGYGIWRRIDDFPPAYGFISCGYGSCASVYVNGCIYYSQENPKGVKDDKPKLIVAFDVGKEKFRAIGIPDFILDQIPDRVQLLEKDGHPALLSRITSRIAKMWLFDDAHSNGYRSSSWKEVTIELPLYQGNGWKDYSVRFHSVVGTDFLILSSYRDRHNYKTEFLQHSYNWKNKTLAEIKIDLSSIPHLGYIYGDAIFVSTFVESLLPVLKQTTLGTLASM